MSRSAATRANIHNRPLSPHLSQYRLIPTMAMSIIHRITGGAMYFGTLLVAWWLIAASVSQHQFDIAAAVLGSWIGLIVLFGYSWALIHHMIGGIRHLVWDTGRGLGKETATKIAVAMPILSVVLTIVVWIIAVATWGA